MRTILFAAISVLLFGLSSVLAQEQSGQTPPKTAQTNPVVFWELASHNQEKSVAFFREVFGWRIDFSERLGFYIVPADSSAPVPDGGIFTLKQARLPFLTIYIQVDDINEKIGLIKSHGGMVLGPPNTTPGGSTFCLFTEPSGVIFAMIQPSPKKQ